MKKYIAPSLLVVNIQNEIILAGSQKFGVNNDDNGYTGSDFNARRYRGGLIDDELEEEFFETVD